MATLILLAPRTDHLAQRANSTTAPSIAQLVKGVGLPCARTHLWVPAPSRRRKLRQKGLRGCNQHQSPQSRHGGLIGCCPGLCVCALPLSICSGAFNSILGLPISPCRSCSLRQAEVWNSKSEFSVAKVWPPSVERFLQDHGKGCKCLTRWGHVERKGVPLPNGAHRCRGLSEGAKGKAEAFWEQPDQGLHGCPSFPEV